MICVFPPDCDDFSGNGLGAICPVSCTVTEELNGEYELLLEHPLDDKGKWRLLADGMILRVPVPRSLTPYVMLPDSEIALDKTSRGAWRLTQRTNVRIWAGTEYKILGTYPSNSRIAVLGTIYVIRTENLTTGKTTTVYSTQRPTGAPEANTTRTVETWYRVTVSGGVTGYIPSSAASNLYHTTDIQSIVGEIVESKQLREQPFRIYRVVPDLDKVTVYARHIFYDLLDGMIHSYEAGVNHSAAQVVKELSQTIHDPHDFQFYSDLTQDAGKFSVSDVNPVEAYLGEDGVIDHYGGELARDWYDVYIVNRVGIDSGVVIREGKNLLGVTYDIDTTEVVTRILPVGQDRSGKPLYLPELFVDSEYIDQYPHPKWMKLDVPDAKISSSLPQSKVFIRLREAARAEFEKGCDLPNVTLDVDFINLYDTEEYQRYASLQNIFIGDTVRVISPRLGLSVSMRMTRYVYDCILKRYSEMTLGTVADTVAGNIITSRQIPSGLITGAKLAIGSVGASQLQDGSVGSLTIQAAAINAAHISQAAIDQLSANAITAVQANIREIAAGTVSADEIVAAFADIAAMHVESLTAQSVQTDRLASALADFTVITAGSAEFSRECVQHLVANAMNLEYGVGDEVFIKNLSVDYAKMVRASVGNLCVRADDGTYYQLSVMDGQVSAVPVSLSQAEIMNGETSSGCAIIETSITASDLSASSLKGIYALINKLDAARIDVDELWAREAFIDHLQTTDITSNTYLQLAIKRTTKVYRQEEMPTDASLNDLWIDPATGYTYQLVETDVDPDLQVYVDDEQNVYWESSQGSDGYSLELENGCLYAQYTNGAEVLFALDDNGFLSALGAGWVRIKDSDITSAYQLASDIQNGTVAVPKLLTAGISIYENHLDIGSTGVLTISANGVLSILNASGNNVLTLNKNGIFLSTGGTFTVSSNRFSIDASGNVTVNGNVTASSGTIGGWQIGASSLSSGSASSFVELNSDPDSDYAFWAGSASAQNAPFAIKRNGEAYITNLYRYTSYDSASDTWSGAKKVDLRSSLWMADQAYALRVTGVSVQGDTLTIQWNGTTVNFRKAAASGSLIASGNGSTNFTVSYITGYSGSGTGTTIESGNVSLRLNDSPHSALSRVTASFKNSDFGSISVGTVYTEGYNKGWEDAAACFSSELNSNVISVTGPSSVVGDTVSEDYTVTVSGSVDSISNVAPNAFQARASFRALVNGQAVKSGVDVKAQTIQVGQ